MRGSDTTTFADDGNRLVTLDRGATPNVVRSTLRGHGGKVIRELRFTKVNDTVQWSWEKDSIWRGSQLLGTDSPSGARHFHLDHLGSPRLITDGAGAVVTQHTYAPFGEELTDPTADTERMKFTGHERDLLAPDSTTEDLDSMHARYYSPIIRRFVSVDPLGGGCWE